MPYVIDVKRFDHVDGLGIECVDHRRRVVATLDEAREHAARVFDERSGTGVWARRLGLPDHVKAGVAEVIGENGGAVHGLRDGTVIEIRRENWITLMEEAGGGWPQIPYGPDDPDAIEIIDAWNERHASKS
jgi:hypothetical protein